MFKRIFFLTLIQVLILFINGAAFASDFSFSGQVYFSDQELRPVDSSLNGNNQILQNPYRIDELDLRMELKIKNEDAKYILRPRWLGHFQEVQYSATKETTASSQGKIDLTDAFGEWNLGTALQLTAGLIVDGWGPAEFVNPTNSFFHMNTQNKNFFFKEKGKLLVKMNWNPTGRTTLSFIAEPLSNQESAYRYDTEFSPSALIRTESQSEDSSLIIGLIAGSDAFKSNLFGEYFTFTSHATGISTYFEGRHTQNSSRFYPISNSGVISLDLTEQKTWSTYSVFGVRYEGAVDARLEWIDYELGYTEVEWNQVLQGLTKTSPYLVQNLKKFQAPGLEFFTKNWVSVSLRIPDFGPKSTWQWTNRVLLSLGDNSLRESSFRENSLRASLLQTDFEMPTTIFGQEAWILYLEGRGLIGDANTEMMLNSFSTLAAGFRYAW